MFFNLLTEFPISLLTTVGSAILSNFFSNLLVSIFKTTLVLSISIDFLGLFVLLFPKKLFGLSSTIVVTFCLLNKYPINIPRINTKKNIETINDIINVLISSIVSPYSVCIIDNTPVTILKAQNMHSIQKELRFFIFANKTSYNKYLDDFLVSHKDISHSIFVFFNKAEPMKHSAIARKHPNKWIFFRSLSQNGKHMLFRDLNLLKIFNFKSVFTVPDILDKNIYNNKLAIDFLNFLDKNNIDESIIRHIGSEKFQPPEYFELLKRIRLKKIKYYHKNKCLSSGLWIYLYIKNKYPKHPITLIGFTGDVDPSVHEPIVEKNYIIGEHLWNKNCELFDCIV